MTHFLAAPPGVLRYVEETDSGFVAEDVAEVGTGAGFGASEIVVGVDGSVHLAYVDDDGALIYARRLPDRAP